MPRVLPRRPRRRDRAALGRPRADRRDHRPAARRPRAQTATSFRAAFARLRRLARRTCSGPTRDGRIGQFIAATMPDRAGFPADDPCWMRATRRRPAPWQRLRDARDLPCVVNPREGVLASANNRPAAGRAARRRRSASSSPTATACSGCEELLAAHAAPYAGRHRGDAGAIRGRPRAAAAGGGAVGAAGRAARRCAGARAAGARCAAGMATTAPRQPRAGRLRGAARAGWCRCCRPTRHGPATAAAPESQWNFLTTFLLRDLDALPPARREAVLREAAHRRGGATRARLAHLGRDAPAARARIGW